MPLRTTLICMSWAAAAGVGSDEFRIWKEAAGRTYSVEEETQRVSYYIANMEEASNMNDLNKKAKFGENNMIDWSADEFTSILSKDTTVSRDHLSLFADDVIEGVENKSPVDWRTKAVTDIPTQGKGCASGWAFAAAAAIEGQRASISGWSLEKVSVEDFIRCDHINKGCSGGTAHEAITWTAENGGVFTADKYPTTDHTKQIRCSRRGKGSPSIAVRGIGALPTSEKEMLHFLRNWGPFAVEICATSIMVCFY